MRRIEVGIAAGELGMLAVSLLAFWCFGLGSDAMGYALVFVWVLAPTASLATSFLAGFCRAWGNLGWLWPVACGFAVMLLPWATFGLANALRFGRLAAPEALMLALGLAVSFLGYGLGVGLRVARQRSCESDLCLLSLVCPAG